MHPVTLETPGDAVPDGDGGYTQSAARLASVYASITPATPHDLERTIAGTVASSATHLVWMHYLPGVTTQTRVLFGSRTFSVTGVQNQGERNVELVLMCEEVVE